MNQWPGTYRDPWLPPAGRGRVGTRLVRGLLWAAVLIAVISVLAFAATHIGLPAPSDCFSCL
jgi:hypothetical protein